MATATAQGTLWVCEDCYLVAAGYDEHELGRPVGDALSLLGDAEFTLGGPHEDDCDGEGDCNCERREFSWSRCEGCGSTLGGIREALTWWE